MIFNNAYSFLQYLYDPGVYTVCIPELCGYTAAQCSCRYDTDDFFCCDIWNVYAAKHGSRDQQVQSNVLYLANADAENHEQSDPV